MVAASLSEFGTRGYGRSDIETWLTSHWIDMAQDVATVRDASDVIVGVEFVSSREPHVRPLAIGAVRPDHVDRGIGTAMLQWAFARAGREIAKAPEAAQVSFITVCGADHPRSLRLMESFDLELARYYIDMKVTFDGKPDDPVVPAGITIRQFEPARELAELARISQDGFRDHYGFVEEPVEEEIKILQHWMEAADHDPTLWWVAEEDGELVGFNICGPASEGDESVGFVSSLAVLPSHRGRGLGRALLSWSLNEFYGRGKAGAALGVDADSLTGAMRLYESVGMTPEARFAQFERVLRGGTDMATTELGQS